MALIEGKGDIEYLANLFADRNVSFYHACQLKDFNTYLELGGIPSRQLMEQNEQLFTNFVTDDSDKENEIWELVFGNLWDYGSTFANKKWGKNSAPVPNPYGPITLKCEPSVLKEAENISVCLRSTGGKGFNRTQEGIVIGDIPRIFYCLSCEDEYQESWIKYSNDLKKEFGINAQDSLNPELSCKVKNQLLNFDNVFQILVDDIQLGDTKLIDVVKNDVKEHGLKIPVYTRFYHKTDSSIRKQILYNLVICSTNGLNTFDEIFESDLCEFETKNWMVKVNKCGIKYQFDRYMTYLANGTSEVGV